MPNIKQSLTYPLAIFFALNMMACEAPDDSSSSPDESAESGQAADDEADKSGQVAGDETESEVEWERQAIEDLDITAMLPSDAEVEDQFGTTTVTSSLFEAELKTLSPYQANKKDEIIERRGDQMANSDFELSDEESFDTGWNIVYTTNSSTYNVETYIIGDIRGARVVCELTVEEDASRGHENIIADGLKLCRSIEGTGPTLEELTEFKSHEFESLGVMAQLPSDAETEEPIEGLIQIHSALFKQITLQEPNSFGGNTLASAIELKTANIDPTSETTTEVMEQEEFDDGWYFTYTTDDDLENPGFSQIEVYRDLGNVSVTCGAAADIDAPRAPKDAFEAVVEFCKGLKAS